MLRGIGSSSKMFILRQSFVCFICLLVLFVSVVSAVGLHTYIAWVDKYLYFFLIPFTRRPSPRSGRLSSPAEAEIRSLAIALSCARSNPPSIDQYSLFLQYSPYSQCSPFLPHSQCRQCPHLRRHRCGWYQHRCTGSSCQYWCPDQSALARPSILEYHQFRR